MLLSVLQEATGIIFNMEKIIVIIRKLDAGFAWLYFFGGNFTDLSRVI